MKQNWKIYSVFCILYSVFSVSAQNVKDSSLFFPMVKFSYSFQLPGGDLAKRFGYNSNVGLNFSIKTKRNLIFGASGSFLFGDQIKENGILDSLKTSSGFIINQNGNPSVVRLFERGFTVSLHVGKLFPILSPNKNSGIIIYAGPVFLRHKIKMDDIGHQSPQLVDPYPKGYDRLTAGLGAHEFIGYMYVGNKRMLNFFGGFEFTQAFTKSQRSYDYDLMKADTDKRIDLLNGIRIGWILPLYKKTPQEFYYH
ncbi:MAG: hypothetical protein HY841_08260 [Bacteroidetes bacterium]|nr:hypothetical protein [Bacteroidota bacterium]